MVFWMAIVMNDRNQYGQQTVGYLANVLQNCDFYRQEISPEGNSILNTWLLAIYRECRDAGFEAEAKQVILGNYNNNLGRVR